MKVIKPNRLSCLTRPYRYLNKDHLAITVYAMVDFSDGFCLETEQRLWALFNEESVRNFGAEVLDFGIPKRTPEIILNAYGYGQYAVDGRTAVSVSVNNVRKDLWVNGDRYWSGGRPSAALPFDSVAINWRNAYGGSGFDDNPQGKGYRETEINGMRARLLPNIEDPAHPVIREGQHYRPVGYSAIPIETPGRNLMLGTYDEHWRVHEFPGFARDIDWGYFNQSPVGQRLNRLEAGDRIVFTHLHPDKETLTTTVPPLVAKAFIKKAAVEARASDFLEPVTLDLTTYWAYPHLEKAILIYQGEVPIDTDDASDISHILYAIENRDAAATRAHYEAVFHQRVDPRSGPMYALLDKQLVDTRLIRSTPFDEIELSPLLRNKLGKLDRELAQNAARTTGGPSRAEAAVKADAELAWLRKSRNGKIARDDVIEELLKRLQPDENMQAAKQMVRSRPPSPRQAFADASPVSKAEREDFLTARREALLASMRQEAEKAIHVGEGPQATASDAAQNALRQLRLQQVDQFETMINGASGALPARRPKGVGAMRRLRIYGPHELATATLPDGYDGYELHGFTATGISYAGWNVAGLAIRESRLSACNFSTSRMAFCELEQVVFTGCDFTNADWTRARFRQCQFIDCRLPDVQSDKTRFEDCRFIRSTLSAWKHFRIALRGCVFEHCRFVNFSALRGRIEQVAFEHCHFLRHSFLNGTIKGLWMHGCQIDSMSFVGIAAIQGLQIAQCQASKIYVAPAITLPEFEVSHSTISASSFRKVRFERGAIVASDMSACDFSESNMRGMRMADSFFKRSLFIRADLSLARVTNSDFSEAQMKSADMTSADLRHVSFFSADLSMIVANAETIQQDVLMERANVYPLRR